METFKEILKCIGWFLWGALRTLGLIAYYTVRIVVGVVFWAFVTLGILNAATARRGKP